MNVNSKYKNSLEMCFVQSVKAKNLYTLKPIRLLVSTTVKSATPDVKCLIFQLTKADTDLFWRRCYMMHDKKDDSRLRGSISFHEVFPRSVTIYRNRT